MPNDIPESNEIIDIQKKEEIKEIPAPITVDEKTQSLIARDNGELYRLVKTFMKGTAFPKTIDTNEKAIAAWQVATSLGLPPIVVMQNLAFVHGSISMWGQLPKALAHRTGQLEEFELIYFDHSQKVISLANKNLQEDVWGSVVQMRRTKSAKNEYFFTEVEAKQAGLFNKKGPWQQYKKIMYGRRAMGHGIKFEFPDAIMGVPIAEYDFHEAPDLLAVSPKREEKEVGSFIDGLE